MQTIRQKSYIIEKSHFLFFFSFSRQPFSESLAAEDAGDEDGEGYEDGAHRVQEDRLLAEIHVLLSELSDDDIPDCVQSSGAEKKSFYYLMFHQQNL